jgi:hypothetical protein
MEGARTWRCGTGHREIRITNLWQEIDLSMLSAKEPQTLQHNARRSSTCCERIKKSVFFERSAENPLFERIYGN